MPLHLEVEVSNAEVPSHVFENLVEVCPAGFLSRDIFRLTRDPADRDMRAVLQCLQRHGVEPATPTDRVRDNIFCSRTVTVATPDQLRASEWLQNRTMLAARGDLPHDGGPAWEIEQRYDGDFEHFQETDVHAFYGAAVLVTEPIAEEIRAWNAPELEIHPVHFFVQDWYNDLRVPTAWRDAGHKPRFSIGSRLTLPLMSETCQPLRASAHLSKRTPLERGSTERVIMVRPDDQEQFWCYKRSDVENVPPFDLAMTAERLAVKGAPLDHGKVFSKRLANLLTPHDDRITWWPIIFEDD